MPCGYKRVVPREATSLDHGVLAVETLLQLPRISVPLMLRLEQLLDKQSQRKEHEDEGPSKETEERVTRDKNALAPIDPATTRANCGRDAACSAPVANTSSRTGG